MNLVARIRWIVIWFAATVLWRYVALTVTDAARYDATWWACEVVRATLLLGLAWNIWRFVKRVEQVLRWQEKQSESVLGRLSRIEGRVTAERAALQDGFIEEVLTDISSLDGGGVTLDLE